MLHIKPDKRSQTSAKLIVEGFYDCMKEKAFSDITITDIQRKSSVGRSTFYRLFDNTIDVLAYECDSLFKDMIQEGKNKKAIDTDQAMILFFTYWTNHSQLLEIIVNEEQVDILYRTYRKYADDIHWVLGLSIVLTEEEIDYFVSIAAYATIGTLVAWIQHGKKESPESLCRIYRTTVSELSKSF